MESSLCGNSGCGAQNTFDGVYHCGTDSACAGSVAVPVYGGFCHEK